MFQVARQGRHGLGRQGALDRCDHGGDDLGVSRFGAKIERRWALTNVVERIFLKVSFNISGGI